MIMDSFFDIGLKDELLRAVAELGFETPMPVQAEVIPYLLNGGGDLVALAQTGTGKTAAFGLPLLQDLDLASACTQVLVLSPTRELCIQICNDLKDYGRYLDDLKVVAVYGGASVRNQLDELKKGAQIIVATPGRLLDFIRRGAVDLASVRTVVMDEADEMLDMGFLDDIDAILAAVPDGHRTLLFSATMPDEVGRLARKYMHEPREIVIGGRNEGTSTVRHICFTVRASEKYRTLKRIVDFYPHIYGIIFCRTKAETQEVSDRLIRDGYNVDALHGDLSQAQRDNVMQRFRLHNIQLLVATDVAARGIDVDDLTHVINYTLPDENEVYTHRSGRTGRAGKTGISIIITNLREKGRIRAIENMLKQPFETGHIPTGKEICSKQIFNLVDRLENVVPDDDELAAILPSVFGKLGWMTKEDLVRRLVSLEFHRFLDYYQSDEDFDAQSDKKAAFQAGRKADAGAAGGRVVVEVVPGYTKMFVNVGKMDGFGPKELLGMINRCIKREVEVGRIDLFTRYSLFDVPEDDAAEVAEQLSTLKMRGRAIMAKPATDEQIARGNQPRNKKSKHR